MPRNKKMRGRRSFKRKIALLVILVLFIVGIAMLTFKLSYNIPENFPKNSIFTVKKGETLIAVAEDLKEKSYIEHPLLFQFFMTLRYGENKIVAGDYLFKNPQPMSKIAKRFSTGEHGMEPRRITFPEGYTVAQMADKLVTVFPRFDKQHFLTLATPREGFLFPDTYEFYPTVTPEEVINTMAENFRKKIALLREKLAGEEKKQDLRDIVIMASILEKETKTPRSRRIVSGILWHRIAIDMRLQVDAPFEYFLGRNTYEVTKEDLKDDSLYNTYTHKGLPIGPIGNPGLDALEAAMNPIPTDYLYYVSDKEGNIYYSKTYDEHLENVKKHL